MIYHFPCSFPNDNYPERKKVLGCHDLTRALLIRYQAGGSFRVLRIIRLRARERKSGTDRLVAVITVATNPTPVRRQLLSRHNFGGNEFCGYVALMCVHILLDSCGEV